MSMLKKALSCARRVAPVLVALAACRGSLAVLPQGDFGSTKAITQATQYTAGTSPTGVWLGNGYIASGGIARLNDAAGNSQTRSMVLAIPNPGAGTYSYAVDIQDSDFKTQTFYFQILGVTTGTVLSLGDGGIPTSISQAGVKSFKYDTPNGASSDGKWKTASSSFTVSASDATTYAYVVFAVIGSRTSSQNIWVDNFNSDAPYSSGATAGLTASWFTLASNPSNLAAVPWGNSPTRTSYETEINWANTNLSWYKSGPADKFAVRLTGSIVIPTTGNWNFSLGSDDGSSLTINGTLVINNDNAHSFTTKTGTITLSAGTYTIDVKFFEAGGSAGMKLQWQSPSSSSMDVVPASAFNPAAAKPRIISWRETAQIP